MGPAVVLSRDTQTAHALPGLKMRLGRPESANGANRNFRLSRPCITQAPTCFVVVESKLVIYLFFHQIYSNLPPAL